MKKVNLKQSLTAGALAATVAVIVNSILFLIFHRAGIITDNIFVQPNQPLSLLPVIISSIIPTFIASILFFLLNKYTSNGFRIFSIVAILLFLLTLAMPFTAIKGAPITFIVFRRQVFRAFTAIKGAPITYILALESMHFVVFLAVMYFIRKTAKNIIA